MNIKKLRKEIKMFYYKKSRIIKLARTIDVLNEEPNQKFYLAFSNYHSDDCYHDRGPIEKSELIEYNTKDIQRLKNKIKFYKK